MNSFHQDVRILFATIHSVVVQGRVGVRSIISNEQKGFTLLVPAGGIYHGPVPFR